MVIASYMAEFTDLEQVWMVVSPQNPLKQQSSLLQDHHRLEMVRLAIGDYRGIKPSRVEFTLPRPSYTIDTLTHLREQHPEHTFVLIMGSDNIATIHKWKNYEAILEQYQIYVYPRPGFVPADGLQHPKVRIIPDVPLMELSSTFIRAAIRERKDIRFMLPQEVYRYIDEMNFYRK